MKITALLVTHDGARWLPAVVEGLESSTRLPDAVLLADTGSSDDSAEIVRTAFGVAATALPAHTGYPEAITTLLAQQPAEPDEWVWLLHDDARPDPDCLAQLIAVAQSAEESVVALGPKLREWPSLKRLLEVGVTLSGAGRRETGLESGEYDQGQHDEPHRALAVNTAGMLVRRDVLDRFGLDPGLPLFGNDLDFGWRLARAGLQVLVVPDAVMFHAEGAHRGRRRGALAQRPHRDERAAALYTLLVNSGPAMLVLRWFRLLFGGLLRAVGHLLVRQPRRAAEELAALRAVHFAPGRIRAGRRRRTAELADAPASARRESAALLAPAWMPLRHAWDFVADVGQAGWGLVRESVHARTGAGQERTVRGQVLRSITVWVLLAVVIAALIGGRHLLTGAPLQGGDLSPVPDRVRDWWGLWARPWNWVGVGSSVSAPAYVLPFAALGTLLVGQTGAITWLLFVFTVPLGFWGAQRFLRRLVAGRPAAYWGAAAYALVPVVSGAIAQGRLGAVAASLLLPWTAGAALRLGSPDSEKHARAVWRTALGLSLITMFAPLAWLVAVVVLVAAAVLRRGALGLPRMWPVVLLPLLTSLPWLVDAVRRPGSLLLEAGRTGGYAAWPTSWEFLAGRLSGAGAAPTWFGLGIAVAAVVALVRTDTRRRVTSAWGVVAVTALVILALAPLTVDLPGLASGLRPGVGFLLLVAHGGLITAAVIAADGAVREATQRSFGWRQPLGAIAVVAALGAVGLGGAWWLAEGTPRPLERAAVGDTPVYMADLAESRPDGATLVVRGGPTASGPAAVDYTVLRGDAVRLGEDGVLALTAADRDLTQAVQRVLAGDETGAATLAQHGIAYVYAPQPVSDEVAGAFDATDGFAGASAEQGDRSWRVTDRPTLSGVEQGGGWWHYPLIAVQVLALVALLVLAAPARPSRRRGESR